MRNETYIIARMVAEDLGEKLDCYTSYYVAPGKWSRERREAREFRKEKDAEVARSIEACGSVLVAYTGGWRKRWLSYARRTLLALKGEPAPITGLN